MRNQDKPDRAWKRRIDRLIDAFGEANAVLNVAVNSRCFMDGAEAPLEAVWPKAIAGLARGIELGVFEPVCHGYLHVDTDALERGELEPREFARMEADEARRKLDAALTWSSSALGSRPQSFIAPNWAYGPGILEALAESPITPWLPPQPGPLLEDGGARESMISTLEGLFRLDYGPLGRLAQVGYPPTIVLHGGLFDGRLSTLSKRHDLGSWAQLFLKRDLFRVPWSNGVSWVGASTLLDHLRNHDRIAVRRGEIAAPEGTHAIVRDRRGVRQLSPGSTQGSRDSSSLANLTT